MKRLCLALVVAELAALLAGPAVADHEAAQRVDRELDGWLLGDFSLIDYDGRAFTQERLKGRWTFVLFGDTRCSERCIPALEALAGMRRRIAKTYALKTTQVLFVSLDPERDTGERLRRYLAPFDAQFVGASGSPDTLARLAGEVRSPGTPLTPGLLLLIGPDRDVRGQYLPPYDVLLLTAQFMKTRGGR